MSSLREEAAAGMTTSKTSQALHLHCAMGKTLCFWSLCWNRIGWHSCTTTIDDSDIAQFSWTSSKKVNGHIGRWSNNVQTPTVWSDERMLCALSSSRSWTHQSIKDQSTQMFNWQLVSWWKNCVNCCVNCKKFWNCKNWQFFISPYLPSFSKITCMKPVIHQVIRANQILQQAISLFKFKLFLPIWANWANK